MEKETLAELSALSITWHKMLEVLHQQDMEYTFVSGFHKALETAQEVAVEAKHG